MREGCDGDLDEFAEQSEREQEGALVAMRERAEADFREGRTVSWDEVKSRNGL